jgi:hypothetical protein
MEKDLAVFLTPFPSLLSSQESRLLHGWVSYTSDLMISIPRKDNPYRTIFMPLALSAQGGGPGQPPENLALLHGIYAMTAFNMAQQQPGLTSSYTRLGTKHHRLCLKHLRRSLSGQQGSQPDAILATIILMTTIDCFTGNWSAWRMHVQGGRQWLLSAWKGPWKQQHTASMLYQIFLMVEAVGTSAKVLHGVRNQASRPYGNDDSIFGMTELQHGYQLDRLFGVTLPILEAIIHINYLGSRNTPPAQRELENLRVKILLNDPRALRLDGIADETERKLLRHHAYVYYYACRIHYERVLYRVAPRTIQHLVRGALEHLEAIAALETNCNVTGLMWPVFVTACEAEDETLYKSVSWFFGKGQKHGISGYSSAHKVLSEVWRRRDQQRGENKPDVRWQQVMADLGLDLLLT